MPTQQAKQPGKPGRSIIVNLTDQDLWAFRPTEEVKLGVADAMRKRVGNRPTPKQVHGLKSQLLNDACRKAYCPE